MDERTITPERIELALKSLDSEAWSKQRGKIADKDLVEMLLCDMRQANDIISGMPYYDYAAQKWVEELETELSDISSDY